ncbi:MAG: 2-oxo acid dehydrogenase subunit E2 [Chloroflexi bacterium]|nr:2-oxo acid dehydrogenase subunit E2 [Chloroflexota bacterium]
MATKVIMPQLGESVVEGTVTRWLKREGEQIDEFASLLEVNTDKVDTEIPSPAGGTLLKILVPEGQTVKAGTILAWIGKPGEAVAEGGGANGAEAVPQAVQESTQSQPALRAAGRSTDLGFISPVVARLAQEHEVDLAQVKGTGAGGRITKNDVLAYLENRPPEAPHPAAEAAPEAPAPWETPGEGDLFRPTELIFGAPPETIPAAAPPSPPAYPARQPHPTPPPAPPAEAPAPALPGTIVPLNPVRKATAERMASSKRTAPHVTTVMEADLSKVVAHREANREAFARDGVNLTYTAYFVAACVAALKAYPLVNSTWSEEGILVYDAINIGMATSLGEEGLIVPVVKAADGLSLLGLARAINDLAERARTRRLKPDEVRYGTFTITNHGISGSLFASPIINQPQCAILGVGAIQKRVVVIQDAIAIRPMVYLSLTFDHRILDGALADHFLAKIVETLQNWV